MFTDAASTCFYLAFIYRALNDQQKQEDTRFKSPRILFSGRCNTLAATSTIQSRAGGACLLEWRLSTCSPTQKREPGRSEEALSKVWPDLPKVSRPPPPAAAPTCRFQLPSTFLGLLSSVSISVEAMQLEKYKQSR